MLPKLGGNPTVSLHRAPRLAEAREVPRHFAAHVAQHLPVPLRRLSIGALTAGFSAGNLTGLCRWAVWFLEAFEGLMP